MRAILWTLCGVLLLFCASAQAGLPDLGPNASLHGYRFFSPDHPWNRDISSDPVDANSTAIINFYNASKYIRCDFGPGYGVPYSVVSGSQRKVQVVLNNGEADMLMFPIPPTAPIEGGGNGGNGDSHILVLDRDNDVIYETWVSQRMNGGKYYNVSFACIFNMRTSVLRPMPWSSADAAGLSMLAGLCRGDEVIDAKVVNHPIRFTIQNSKMSFVVPATHRASSLTGSNYLPMGARLRLKASYNTTFLPEQARIIAEGFKKYGLILADNGIDYLIQGSPDTRWNANSLATITGINMSNYELVQRGEEYRY